MNAEFPIHWSRYRLKDEVVARDVEKLRPYPFVSLVLPGPAENDFALLLESVRANGVMDPLTVTPAGEVVDGQTRLRAARSAGRHSVPTRTIEAPTEPDYALWAAVVNVGRRHLTTQQRFTLLQAALVVLETQARARQRATYFRPRAVPEALTGSDPGAGPAAGDGGSVRLVSDPTVLAGLPIPSDPSAGSTNVQAARLLGVSARQAGKMIAIAKRGSPELRHAVEAGQVSVNRAYERLPRGRDRSRGAHLRDRRESDCRLTGVADQAIRTLRSIAAQIVEWLERCPGWPPEHQERFWLAVEDVRESCEMGFQRRQQLR
jgi:hypothetical protein